MSQGKAKRTLNADQQSGESAAAEAPTEPLPPVLQPDLGAFFREQLLKKYQPRGPIEMAIVRDLARRMGAMERWGKAAEAVARQAYRRLASFETTWCPGNEAEEAPLAGAMAAEVVDRVERQALAHSRAFYRTHTHLEEEQARRKRRETQGGGSLPPPFPDETACEAYLAARLGTDQRPCPHCQGTQGRYLSGRKAWECTVCQTQSGLRVGTVMARSPLPLWKWFEAIRRLLWQPTISVADLAERLDIPRRTTVRNMARKIRDAMAQDDASRQLAGLDVLFSRASPSPEPSARLPQMSGSDPAPPSQDHKLP